MEHWDTSQHLGEYGNAIIVATLAPRIESAGVDLIHLSAAAENVDNAMVILDDLDKIVARLAEWAQTARAAFDEPDEF